MFLVAGPCVSRLQFEDSICLKCLSVLSDMNILQPKYPKPFYVFVENLDNNLSIGVAKFVLVRLQSPI